ncbi:Card1-like endonuclease domain-containing protein [Clostridium ganghwense]|uniref:DUF1887 family CARF protein n=1 Tax=Clostridium ganghwense TaxID=312089 RepID=A0ABT4CME3_9CLOT|nr:DUF1887 family CARF protein [Clostridium ganghwense]MCY6370222.1 DUF1887 family CARF protein [Clostridium ganghwense]
MECKNLINLLDEFNGQNVLAVLNLKPKKIVFVYEDDSEEFEEFEIIKSYLKDRLPDAEIIGVPIKEIKTEAIENILSSYNGEDTVINLSGGSKLMSLITYQAAEKHKMTSILVDVDHQSILNLSNKEVRKLNIEFNDLEVEDFIQSTGGEIISHSTDVFNSAEAKEFVDYIVDNYDFWDKLKPILIDNNIIKQDVSLIDTVVIKLGNIHEADRIEFKKFLAKIKELNSIHVKYESEYKLVIQFNNPQMKPLFFKVGTWLEVLVYEIVKEIKEVDDVKSGVQFLWDNEVRYVKNEIDVLASVNSQLVYISCKDTAKYDEDTLNELDVYSEQLGGNDVKKVLVTTKEPYKRSTTSRAEEMGIDIIIFDGNVEELKNKLRNIIVS